MKSLREIIEQEIERHEDLLDGEEMVLEQFNESIKRMPLKQFHIRRKNEILNNINIHVSALEALEEVLYLYDEKKR